MTEVRGLQQQTFGKRELLERIRSNLATHRDVYEHAMSGYRGAAQDWFDEQLGKALQGKPFEVWFKEPVPEDHTEDYEAVIDQLELSQEDVVTLSLSEFRQYVRDEWGWKKEFMATTSNYLGNA
jgi:hypothetical protein